MRLLKSICDVWAIHSTYPARKRRRSTVQDGATISACGLSSCSCKNVSLTTWILERFKRGMDGQFRDTVHVSFGFGGAGGETYYDFVQASIGNEVNTFSKKFWPR